MRLRFAERLPGFPLLPALIAMAEFAWAYLWMAWVSGLQATGLVRPALSWPASAALILVSILLTRWLLPRSDSRRLSTGMIVLAAGVVAILVVAWLNAGSPRLGADTLRHLPDRLASSPGTDIALAFGAYLWWRGIAIARADWYFDDLTFRFGSGVAALMAGLFANGLTDSTLGAGALSLLALQYFTAMLPALALAHLRDIRREHGADGSGLGLSREWVAVLAITVLGIALVSAIIASSLSFDLASTIRTPMTWVADALVFVVLVIALPIGYLVAAMIWLVRLLIARGGPVQPFNPPVQPDNLKPGNNQSGKNPLPDFVFGAGKWVLLAIVIVVIGSIVVRAMFRYRSRHGDDVEEIHESLWPGGSLLAMALGWLLLQLRRLWPHRRPELALQATGTMPIEPTVRTVREAYRAWLVAASGMGRGRRASETPDEFIPSGLALVPDGGGDLLLLTRAYEVARYAPSSLTEEIEEMARRSWQRLRTRLPGGTGEQP